MARKRSAQLALVALGIWASSVRAQGIEVDHKPVDCIVAGKYARIDACLTPVGNVARARLYFKTQSAPTWYFVEMKTEGTCHAGVLPKAKKTLVSQKLLYYVQVFDNKMAEGRSQEYRPTIVESSADCAKEKLLAPLSGAGPAAVFPALPTGFVAGAGATPFVVGGVAAAAAGGGGVAVAAAKDDPAPAPTPATTPLPTPMPIPTPTPTPPPPTLELGCTATPSSGPAPLTVEFNGTPKGGTGVYEYLWEFGTGEISQAKREKYTYKADGKYDATLTVTSGTQKASCRRQITVSKAGKVNVSIDWVTGYSDGYLISTPSGISCTYKAGMSGACAAPFDSGTSVTLTATCVPPSLPEWMGGCIASPGSPTCTFTPLADTAVKFKCYTGTPVAPADHSVLLHLRTSLEALGARGRVTADGVGMAAVESGGPTQLAVRRGGVRRIDALVDEIRGPGLWRFDLTGAGVEPGSIRVLAGEAVLVGPDSVVFRVSGRPGERIVFTLGR